MISRCEPEFWEYYRSLSPKVRELTDKNFRLWREDTTLPGLDFKKLGGQKYDIWQARVGIHYRALCVRNGEEFVWFWIGTKDECSKMV